MHNFWLATWGTGASPVAGATRWAIEVVHDRARYVVLLSAADRLEAGGVLECRIGFANDAQECCRWRSRGFPVVDAGIRQLPDGWLEVWCPFFSAAQASMHYGEPLLSLRHVQFEPSEDDGARFSASYRQSQDSPEPGMPATFMLRKQVDWGMDRTRVRTLQPQALEVWASTSILPDLGPLRGGPIDITNAWAGLCNAPPNALLTESAESRFNRSDLFGPPGYAFGEVEALDFRLDLSGKDVAALLAPLNARQAGQSGPGYTVRATSHMVMLQLLRYGRMRSAGDPLPPLHDSNYQSQHELLARVNVIRVDDTTGSMHHPALHVPVIFVDNPWSKLLGRDLEGFDKRMADFCVAGSTDGAFIRLRPDGLPGADLGDSADLRQVTRVHFAELASPEETSAHPPLIELQFDAPGKWDFDPRLIHSGWRLADFDLDRLTPDIVEDLVQRSLGGFDSIQATPVDERNLQKAWIAARCSVRPEDAEFPSAAAHLTFHALPSAPPAWLKLCELLGASAGSSVSITLQPGDWYRSTFSMDLDVLNG